MELRWRLLDLEHVKIKVNTESLSTEEVETLIRTLGKIRMKMKPSSLAQPAGDDNRPTAGTPAAPDTNVNMAPGTSAALDAIAHLLSRPPQGGAGDAIGLLETFAKIGEIAGQCLAPHRQEASGESTTHPYGSESAGINSSNDEHLQRRASSSTSV